MSEGNQYAAIDLGSSSFHMVVARVDQGGVHVMDRLRERVGLAAGMDADQNLDADTRKRALDCLLKFGERLAELPTTATRAVGTNTLRRAKNAREFLPKFEEALGHSIELVSGQEEARLVYLGVARSVPEYPQRRLVVDIGGSSTELIVGQGNRPIERDSVQMGHLRWSIKFFQDGFTKQAFEDAHTRARIELGGIKRRYRALGWEAVYGSSGTIKSIEAITREAGWAQSGITLDALNSLKAEILSAGDVASLRARNLAGLSHDRAVSIAGGGAILRAVFETFHIEEMVASQGALREGVLHDLLGRLHHEDARDLTIASFQQRYSVDREHAARVERTALSLFHQVCDAWSIDRLDGQRFVSWACLLHEVGLSVNHSGYHKHGAYLLRHADMPGFSRADQALLASAVGNHRRKLHLDRVSEHIGPSQLQLALQFTVLLRLAVRLHRTRSSRSQPPIAMSAKGNDLVLRFPVGWLAEHPLKHADLVDEASLLPAVGFSLNIV
ncbi:MAG: Ppx/GppA family phosphatase [Deltaproteobacteria bacterium]|nr:Ppx/GppA family phosphatase [Deltaproteobacteria bacterium]